MTNADQNLEAGLPRYGATETRKSYRKQAILLMEKPSIGVIIGCVVVPTLVFILTFWLLSFNLRYWYSSSAFIAAVVVLLGCLYIAWMAYQAAMGKGGNPVWLSILCILCVLAWIFAFIWGNDNFHSNMQNFYDLETMNVYESVDPSTTESNQYMDFGVIQFAEGAYIDRMYTMAFVNDDTYCVAPIKMGNAKMETYDYWAVGTNCCSKHLFNFNCGEWNNPAAHSGLRVMSQKQRSFYRLATEQAEAAYDIPVHHPVFLTWVDSPLDQIMGYQQDGFKNLELGTFFIFFGCLLLVVLAGWCVPYEFKM